MPAFQLQHKNVVFVHIPKTGGSSVDDWLYDFDGCKRLLFSPQPLPDMPVTPQHLCYKTIMGLLGDAFPVDYSFAVVRNPYKRLESEFKYRLDLGLLRGHANPDSLFAEWVNFVLNRETSSPGTLDNHLRPQTYFMGPDVQALKFENGLNEAARIIAEQAGLTVASAPVLPNTKTSKKRHLVWTHKMIARVQQFYAADFAEFRYDTSPEGLNVKKDGGLFSQLRQYYHFDRKH